MADTPHDASADYFRRCRFHYLRRHFINIAFAIIIFYITITRFLRLMPRCRRCFAIADAADIISPPMIIDDIPLSPFSDYFHWLID
jgi:hypothetical protein